MPVYLAITQVSGTDPIFTSDIRIRAYLDSLVRDGYLRHGEPQVMALHFQEVGSRQSSHDADLSASVRVDGVVEYTVGTCTLCGDPQAACMIRAMPGSSLRRDAEGHIEYLGHSFRDLPPPSPNFPGTIAPEIGPGAVEVSSAFASSAAELSEIVRQEVHATRPTAWAHLRRGT